MLSAGPRGGRGPFRLLVLALLWAPGGWWPWSVEVGEGRPPISGLVEAALTLHPPSRLWAQLLHA